MLLQPSILGNYVKGTINPVAGPWPGQVGNTVGFQGAPGYTGPTQLTVFSGSLVTNTTYSFKIFDAGTDGSGFNINANGLTFIGCYFGASNNSSSGLQHNCHFSGGGTPPQFKYCTFGPSPSVIGGSFPPVVQHDTGWPSSTSPVYNRGATTDNSCSCTNAQGYGSGPVLYGAANNGEAPCPSGGVQSFVTPAGTLIAFGFDSCDFWGWGQGMVTTNVDGTVNPLVFNNCWIHDPRGNPIAGDHQDGFGDPGTNQINRYMRGTPGHPGVTINHCTVACVGNTQNLALQTTPDYTLNNIQITNNFWAGNEVTLAFGMTAPTVRPSNFVFTGNVIGPTPSNNFTDPIGGFVSDGATNALFSISGSGNKWRNNMILPGTTYVQGGVGHITVTSANPWFYPDGSANTTDFTGAF